jgi:hypothetical protein
MRFDFCSVVATVVAVTAGAVFLIDPSMAFVNAVETILSLGVGVASLAGTGFFVSPPLLLVPLPLCVWINGEEGKSGIKNGWLKNSS